MNESERYTKKRLEFLGLNVEHLESNHAGQSADFFASDSDNAAYIIEVKSRATDKDFNKQLIETGESYREEIDGRTNVASRKVKKAEKQLRSTQSEKSLDNDEIFRIIAFVSLQENDDVDVEQFRSTLYGIVKLIIPDESGDAKSVPCFYFSHSDFYRFPTIDGVILLTKRWMQLCPNPFGSQSVKFENSFLFRKFSDLDAVFIPIESENVGDIFIVDGDIDRSDEETVKRYIKKKYNLKNIPIVVKSRLMEQAILIDKQKFLGQ